MEYVLVIYIYAGMLAKGDSVALQSVYGFKSESACVAAGEKTKSFVAGSTKSLRFTCLPVESAQ